MPGKTLPNDALNPAIWVRSNGCALESKASTAMTRRTTKWWAARA